MLIRQGAMPLQGALMTFPLWLFSTVFLWLHPPSGFTLLYTPFLLWYYITAQIFEVMWQQKMTSSLYSVHCPQYYTSLSPYILLLRSEGPYKLHSRRPLYNHSALILWQFTACMYHIQCAITFSEIMLESLIVPIQIIPKMEEWPNFKKEKYYAVMFEVW